MKKLFFMLCVIIVSQALPLVADGFADNRIDLIAMEMDRVESGQIEAQELDWTDNLNGQAADRDRRIDQALVRAASGGIKTKNFCWEDVCVIPSSDPKGIDLDQDFEISGQAKKPYSFYEEWIDPKNPRNDFSLAFEAFDYNYREPSLMKDDGMMAGIHGSYTHRTQFNKEITSLKEIFQTNGVNMFRWDVRYAADNNMKYRSSTTGDLKGEKHSIFETRLVFGYDFPYKTKHVFTPYVGLGYWFLNDHDGRKQSTTGNWSYNREQEYWYLPVGIDYQRNFEQNWSVRMNLEYDFFIEGTNKSYFNGLSASFGTFGEDGVHDQTDGHGYRGSVRIAKGMGPVEFFVEPFFLTWHIDDSDLLGWVDGDGTVVGYTLEPDNRTTQYGAKIGMNF